MDYPNRRRLKILGRIRIEYAESVGAQNPAAMELSGYKARVERIVTIDIVAFDWNCPQHITPRYTEEEILADISRYVPEKDESCENCD